MLRGAHTSFFCVLALLAARVRGDQTFQWKFGNNFVQQEFTECQTIQIVVEPLTNQTAAGVPPYFLYAYEVGGIPTVTNVGSSNLSWTAIHRRGSKLMLSMMDSNSSTGGVSPTLFTMEAGSNTTCLPTLPPEAEVAHIHPNVTDEITTCEPWGLTITGGTKPYTITLSALNSPVVTISSMGANDDVYTYIDRADPNGQLMASVVDATGAWGFSSNITRTAGSTDVDCTGWVSSSHTSAEIAQEEAAAQASAEADKRRRTHLILGLVLGLGVATALGLAIAFWLYKRRKANLADGIWDNQDVFPRPLPYSDDPPESGDMREVGAAPRPAPALKSIVGPSTPSLEITPIPPVYFDREVAEARQYVRPGSRDTSSALASATDSPSGRRTAVITPLGEGSARYRKTLEASRGHLYTSSSSSAQASSSSFHAGAVSLKPMRSNPDMLASSLIPASLDPDVQPDIIIQHRDGGVVQELPPPYADRSGQATQTSPSELPESPASLPPTETSL